MKLINIIWCFILISISSGKRCIKEHCSNTYLIFPTKLSDLFLPLPVLVELNSPVYTQEYFPLKSSSPISSQRLPPWKTDSTYSSNESIDLESGLSKQLFLKSFFPKSTYCKSSLSKSFLPKSSLIKSPFLKSSFRKSSLPKSSLSKLSLRKSSISKPSIRKSSLPKSSLSKSSSRKSSRPKQSRILPPHNASNANPSRKYLTTNKFDPMSHKNWKFVNDEKCGSTTENRIIGGVDASLGQFPWITRIGYSDSKKPGIQYRCGGALINHKFVLTAGHCVTDLPTNFAVATIRLGEYDIRTNKDCNGDLCADAVQDYNIENVFIHNLFGKPKNSNDIALIKLENRVEFTQWITPICLPFGSLLHKNLPGSVVDIAGWGLYDPTIMNGSNILQTVKLPVLEPKVCIQKFRRFNLDKDKQLCVGGQIGKDSCSGDSGGPLMKVEGEGNAGPKYYIFGIVSFGATYCGLTSNPAIYTNVVNYLKWILDTLDTK